MNEKPRRLGRGLEALLGGGSSHSSPREPAVVEAHSGTLRELPLTAIATNPFQPRRSFNPEELAELESSLQASGLLQPVAVRQVGADRYQLISGERRLRAATRLGWTSIPAVVKELSDRDMLVLALVENLQRADLNPLDEALGLQRLVSEFGLSQQQVADAIGKDRSTVANLLRILSLPEGVRKLVSEGAISLGHARALLALPNDSSILEAAKRIASDGLSVRDVERIGQESKATARRQRTAPSPARPRPENLEVKRLREQLRRRLQTDVVISFNDKDGGSLTLTFYSPDDLHRLAEAILGSSLGDA